MTNWPTTAGMLMLAGLCAAAMVLRAERSAGAAGERRVAVSFSGGHDIGRNDYGRPVTLIAAALGVAPEVFRRAFSDVSPARGRGPTGDEARQNKAALLKVLGPKGVTNERLDEVSDYYRFRPDRGERWPTRPAKAEAIVEHGQVTRIVVTDPGSGYCSPPQAGIEGFPSVELTTTLEFSKDLKKNGAVAKVELLPARQRQPAHD